MGSDKAQRIKQRAIGRKAAGCGAGRFRGSGKVNSLTRLSPPESQR